MNTLKNIGALMIIAIAMLCIACGGQKNLPGENGLPYKGLDNALLWKIEGQGLTVPSYLYGTIHIINGKDYFLPTGTLSAMDEASDIVFEIDMSDMTDMSNVMGLMSAAVMKDGKSLKDLVTQEEYDMISNHFNKMGLPLFLFEKMKPMFLTVFASSDFDPQGLQNGSLKSYEMEFMEIAEQSGKTVSGLETIEYQMSIFDSIPYEDQAKMLVETIKTSDMGSDQFKQMVEIYKSQDIDAMVTMIGEDEQGLGDFEDVMLNNRNENWIPIMKEMMGFKTVFFAVGAGHLAGPKGVIHLLREEGYSVSPVKTQKI